MVMHVMGLLTILRAAVAGHPPGTEATRQALKEAMKSGCPIELSSARPGAGASRHRVNVLALRDAVVLTSPPFGGVGRPLCPFELLTMHVQTADGPRTGATQVLARTRIKMSDGRVLSAFKLSLPRELVSVERRRDLRRALGDDQLREARLTTLAHRSPILGLVEDISAGGACLRCRNAGRALGVGMHAHLRLELAEELGPIDDTVTILALSAGPGEGEILVRVRFHHRQEVGTR